MAPTEGMSLVAGIDVGGTNTDAVLLNTATGAVVAAVKVHTQADVSKGIVHALQAVLKTAGLPSAAGVRRCCIGTTHCINAIVSRSRDALSPVFVVRIGGEQSSCLPPFCFLPSDLRDVIEGGVGFIVGGHNIFNQEHEPLDEQGVRTAVAKAVSLGVTDFVVSSPFSPHCTDHEDRARGIIDEEMARLGRPHRVTLSHEVAGFNLIKRENAAVLNAALRPMAERMTSGLEERLRREVNGLACEVLLTQNDGTVLSLKEAALLPALTFGSGPTNSMRGAAFVTGRLGCECVVVDIGGTTSDVGLLLKDGFPHQSNVDVHVGGCLINSRIPAVTSAPIGGGSLVDADRLQVGPGSVGFRLTNPACGAVVFGGPQLTATDVAVRLGRDASLGSAESRARVESAIDEASARCIEQSICSRIQACVDSAKTSAADVPLLLVGGGTLLLPPDAEFEGVSTVHRPPLASVANAIGAALAQASAEHEAVYDLGKVTREEAEDEARSVVVKSLMERGVQKESIEVVKVSVNKVGFIAAPCYHVSVRAVGSFDDLAQLAFDADAMSTAAPFAAYEDALSFDGSDAAASSMPGGRPESPVPGCMSIGPAATVQLPPGYQRCFDDDGIWHVSEYDLECISLGAGILGCGGGGNTLFGLARARQRLCEGRRIRIAPASRLTDADTIVTVAFLGAPSAACEMLGSGHEMEKAAQAVVEAAGCDGSLTYVACAEIGGMNAIEPLSAGAMLDVPIVDADAMGRAYPTVLQYLPWILGTPAAPIALQPCWSTPPHMYYAKGQHAGAKNAGRQSSEGVATPEEANAALLAEVCNDVAGVCGMSLPPLSADELRRTFVMDSYTVAFELGRAVLQAQRDHDDCVASILKARSGSCLLFQGNTGASVAHLEGTPWDVATCSVRGVEEFAGQTGVLCIQNEYICFRVEGRGVLAATPDLVVVVDRETGRPIFSDEVKTGYGLRIAVLMLPAPEVWKTHPNAIALSDMSNFAFNEAGEPCAPSCLG